MLCGLWNLIPAANALSFGLRSRCRDRAPFVPGNASDRRISRYCGQRHCNHRQNHRGAPDIDPAGPGLPNPHSVCQTNPLIADPIVPVRSNTAPTNYGPQAKSMK